MWMVPGLVSVEAPIAPFTADDWEEINDPTSIKRPRREVRAILEDKAEFHRALLLVHDMRSMGVQFLAGTGTLGKNVVPGRSIHREVELLVKSGFTTLDALRTATLNPALYLAKLDRYGVVEPGHVANLVLLDENPLEDITNIEKIDAVIAAGKYFSRAELSALLSGVKSVQAAVAGTSSSWDAKAAR